MKQDYFALLDNEKIAVLGPCSDFDEADSKATARHGTYVWMFSRDGLTDFRDAATEALK